MKAMLLDLLQKELVHRTLLKIRILTNFRAQVGSMTSPAKLHINSKFHDNLYNHLLNLIGNLLFYDSLKKNFQLFINFNPLNA